MILIPTVVFPSAGHHNNDPGAVYNGIKEADKTKELRNLISKYLGSHKHIMDNDWETNSQYQNRIKPASGSVIFDIHFNASTNSIASGTEMIISNSASENSKKMAAELASGTSLILGIPNRGVKTEKQTARGKIGILNLPAGISVLAEVCFLSNLSDMAKYDTNKDRLACFYAETLIKYDNLI